MNENSASVRDKYCVVGHSNAGDANRWARPLADPIVRILKLYLNSRKITQ